MARRTPPAPTTSARPRSRPPPQAVQRGGLVVLPTDTVYGVGADAFDHAAVQALLDAKGRGRDMPPPVLISARHHARRAGRPTLPAYVEALIEAFWPGPLTLVCEQQPSLTWDLGETRGTVAVRMPDHAIALALLERTGPLAVSSANLSGLPAATEAGRPRGCSASTSRSSSTAVPARARRPSDDPGRAPAGGRGAAPRRARAWRGWRGRSSLRPRDASWSAPARRTELPGIDRGRGRRA